MPNWRKLVLQRSRDPSRCRSSSVSWRQRPKPTSRPRRPISRAPQSTPSIGAPVRRSALVTRSSPSNSSTAPQAESRGRLSSGASKGSSSTVRPRGRASSPPRVASMAEAGRVQLHCACSARGVLCLNRGVLCLKLTPAHLAELVDALGLGSSGFGRGGSSPPVGMA